MSPLKNIAGWLPAAILQPLSKGLIEKAIANGGNPMRISASEGPLIRKSASY